MSPEQSKYLTKPVPLSRRIIALPDIAVIRLASWPLFRLVLNIAPCISNGLQSGTSDFRRRLGVICSNTRPQPLHLSLIHI